MAAYIVYLLFLLSVIAFSPTRYFSFSYIALLSAIPGIIYSVCKKPSKILVCLLLLFMVSVYSGWNNNLRLWSFDQTLTDKEIIASSSIWLISFVVMKLSLNNRTLNKFQFIKYFFALFFIIGIKTMVGELMGLERAMDEGSNSVYYILPVLPCFMYYYPKYRYYALMLVIVLIIFSIKRSAFLIIVFSVLWLMYCSYKKIIVLKKNILWILTIGLVGSVLVMTFGSDYLDAILDRFSNISEDGGSGRDLIFESAWTMFMQADINHQLLGSGPRFFWANSQTITAAHDDFLEIIISCGIIGVLIFIVMHVLLIKMIVYLVKAKSDVAIPMGICYIMFLVWNLIACQFAYQSPAVPTFMFFSLVEHLIYKRNEYSIRS